MSSNNFEVAKAAPEESESGHEDVIHQIIHGDIEQLRQDTLQVIDDIEKVPSTKENDGLENEKQAIMYPTEEANEMESTVLPLYSPASSTEKKREPEPQPTDSGSKQISPEDEESHSQRVTATLEEMSEKIRNNNYTMVIKKPLQNQQDDKDKKDWIQNPQESGDGVTRAPGAIRVESRGLAGRGNDDSMEINGAVEATGAGAGEEPVVAAVIDEDELEANLKDKIMANAVEATEVSHAEQNTSKQTKIGILILLLLFLCVGLIVGLVLRPKEETGDDKKEIKVSDEEFLMELLMPVSGEKLMESDSAQSKAFSWLTFDDPADLDIQATNSSVLIERYVMAVVYFSTDGPNWNDDVRFLSNYSICEWPNIGENEPDKTTSNEVDCDESGHVIKLALEQNNLNGTIPSELSALSNIETISFGVSNLYGTLPPELSQLSRLNFFQVAVNSLTGTIPESYAKLTSMETISFFKNQLTGTIPQGLISGAFHLDIADFAANNFEGTIPEFRSQSGVTRIYMEDNHLEGSIPSSIYSLQNLEQLYLSNNNLNGTIARQIKSLQSLIVCDLSGNSIPGTLPTDIGMVQDLVALFLGNNQLSGSIPSELGNLDRVSFLDLSSNSFSMNLPSDISKAGNLGLFDVSSNQLTGTVPQSYAEMDSLTKLVLNDNNITGGLDTSFCQNPTLLTEIVADCAGDDSAIDCECCTSCCDDTTCYQEVDAICNIKASNFMLEPGRGATCTCTENGQELKCRDTECESCNLDETLCAANTDYGYSLNRTTGEILSFQNTIKLTKGYDNVTIVFEESEGCNVEVNGQKCTGCSNLVCTSGFEGFQIFCDNIEGGFNFHSCENFDNSGYLQVFSLFDNSLNSGCPLVLERV